MNNTSYNIPKEYFENVLDEMPLSLPASFREEFIRGVMKNSPGGARKHISFFSFVNITNMTMNINNLTPIVRRINLYFDKEIRNYAIPSNSGEYFKRGIIEDEEDFDILYNSASPVQALNKIFQTTHSPITIHSNPYFDGRIDITFQDSYGAKSMKPNDPVEEEERRKTLQGYKTLAYPIFTQVSSDAYTSKTHDYQSKISKFVNQMTWFQYSALLEYKKSHDKNKKNHHSNNKGPNEQLNFPISCLPLFLFMLISPTAISEIVKLGRNDISQRNITTNLSTSLIRSLVSSVQNMDGDKLLTHRQAIIDMYSHFSRIIISAILSSPKITLDTAKDKAGNFNKIIIDTTSIKFDDFFWLNMDIFTNMANIGSEATVPLFTIDRGFESWYKDPDNHDNLDPDILNKQFNPYKDPNYNDQYKFLKSNPYLNWESESFLLKNNDLIPFYSITK